MIKWWRETEGTEGEGVEGDGDEGDEGEGERGGEGRGGAEFFLIFAPNEKERTREEVVEEEEKVGGDTRGDISERRGEASVKKTIFLRCNRRKRSISCIMICNCNPRFENVSSKKKGKGKGRRGGVREGEREGGRKERTFEK